MNQETIFIPFFGVILLTMLVWMYMYYLRLSFIAREQIDPQSLATVKQGESIFPPEISKPSENLINLFEMPVLFYAVCLYLYATGSVDGLYLVLSFGFLVFRLLHSIVHCTYNKVTHRFYIYVISSLMLWIMILRAIINTVQLSISSG